GDVPCDHAAGADHSAVADGDARQDDGAAADPDVAADPDRAAEFEPGATGLGIAGMIGSVDLHRGADLGAVADHDLDDVEDDAVEIEEDAVAETDVVAIVAEERRTDHGVVADMAESLAEQRVPFADRQRQRGVVTRHPRFRSRLFGAELGIGAIELAREHFLLLGFHPIMPSFGNAIGAAANCARARAESLSICLISASTLENFS